MITQVLLKDLSYHTTILVEKRTLGNREWLRFAMDDSSIVGQSHFTAGKKF